MKIKTTNIAFFTFAIVIIIAAYFFFQHKLLPGRKDVISCQSRHTLIHGDFELHANYAFTFNGNKGELSISGITTEGGKHFQISRAIYFSYLKSNNTYTLKSQHIENLSADKSLDSNINRHFPSFFYEPEKNITLKIMDDKYHNKVIFLYNMPLYYCNVRV
ncbi:hypothetical protein ACMYSK_23785 [Klebsiella sp. I138]|uniref:hypothetical protein n=1 Tax=Klebsiella sp. I138 TaxID=2755385 RepID=UPI003DA94657